MGTHFQVNIPHYSSVLAANLQFLETLPFPGKCRLQLDLPPSPLSAALGSLSPSLRMVCPGGFPGPKIAGSRLSLQDCDGRGLRSQPGWDPLSSLIIQHGALGLGAAGGIQAAQERSHWDCLGRASGPW